MQDIATKAGDRRGCLPGNVSGRRAAQDNFNSVGRHALDGQVLGPPLLARNVAWFGFHVTSESDGETDDDSTFGEVASTGGEARVFADATSS